MNFSNLFKKKYHWEITTLTAFRSTYNMLINNTLKSNMIPYGLISSSINSVSRSCIKSDKEKVIMELISTCLKNKNGFDTLLSKLKQKGIVCVQ